MGEDATGHLSTQRVSVDEAARRLGLPVDAIRKRIARGTIAHERGEHGRVWVLLDIDQDTGRPQSDSSALISAKDETIATLREQLEAERQAHAEVRRIIAGLVERIPPAIDAPSETPGAPTEAAGEPERTEPWTGAPGPQERVSRPWWRRVFGG